MNIAIKGAWEMGYDGNWSWVPDPAPYSYQTVTYWPYTAHAPIVKVKKLKDDAVIPCIKSAFAAGADLVAVEDAFLIPGEIKLIPTGIAIEIPIGYEGQIRSRSGLALKSRVFVLNSPGTIDADYRGEIGVILCNAGTKDFEVKKGDRIAQLVIAPVATPFFQQVQTLSSTDRGDGGFGSTGGVSNG